jgi:DsbC/DsbD-like thiol-disulfide interchange protein
MPARTFHVLVVTVVAAAVTYLAAAAVVRAADASGWQREQHSAARLIGGQTQAGRQGSIWRAGIDIALDPGWKTYWRYPGDSGIPPRFNFAGSRNLRDVQVQWPAPMRFSDGVGMSIGYAERVVLPLQVRPRDAAKPVTLRLQLDYAVCEKLCVPVTATMELPLTGAKSENEDLLRVNEARVPRKSLIGEEGPLAIAAVRREQGAKPRLVVDVRGQGDIDVFADGPNERWSLPLPEPVGSTDPGIRRFAFVLDGIPPDAEIAGAQITLTAVSRTDAVEVAFHLD